MGSLNCNKPWLDEKGQALTDKQLQKVSKNWSQSVWDTYLTQYETPLYESQVHPKAYSEMAEKIIFNFFDLSQSSADEALEQRIRTCLKKLSPKQRKIIELIFWKDLSEREIALELNISRSSVKTIKKRVLHKLSIVLASEVSPIFPLMKGENKFSQIKKEKMDENQIATNL